FPSLGRQPLESHFIPVATSERVYGVSLLEARRGQPVWQADLPGDSGLLPQIGPYGASFCTIQTRRELTVLDPATGETLWQRIELPAERGLHGDHAAGLFGDDEALVLLDADGVSYTVYKTRTGEEDGRGRLPIDPRRQRRTYGRKLFFVETGESRSVARLWDPVTGGDDLALPFAGRLLQTSTRDDRLVLLFADGRLLIVEPRSGETVVDVRLDPAEAAAAHTIQVFSDDERFYVSLYRADPGRFEEAKVAGYVYDTPLTTAHVQGRLLAIDRRTAAVVWSRATEQRSVLDPVEYPLPFLVATARVSDRRGGNRKTLLVEAIDKRTGATLGRNEALLPDQLLQVRYGADKVELAGMTSTVVLEFGPEAQSDAPLVLGLDAAAQ
ncbi:MAG TPA: PQQ-binding-like beta-propeller repeat protein, partial [Planctomycetaceae bacterium]